MLIEKIKPMPKYIEKLIKKHDKKLYSKPVGNTRYYAYLTKNDGELVKVTVASLYLMQNRYIDAKQIIDTLPYMYPYLLNDKMRVSSYSLKGEDRLKEAKDWKIIEYQELFLACIMEGEGYFETGDYKNALKSFTEGKDVIERFMLTDKICPEAYLFNGVQTNHMCCYLQMAGCFLKLNDIENCKQSVEKAYEIVSLANGEDFIKQPELFLEQYNKTCKEYGLETNKPL